MLLECRREATSEGTQLTAGFGAEEACARSKRAA